MWQFVTVCHSLLLTNNSPLYGCTTCLHSFSTLSTFGSFPLFVCSCDFWHPPPPHTGIVCDIWMVWCKEFGVTGFGVTCLCVPTPMLLLINHETLVKLYSLPDPLFPRLVQINILHCPVGLMWGLSEITVEQFSISWIGSHVIWAFPWRSCIFYIKVIWIMPGYYTLF